MTVVGDGAFEELHGHVLGGHVGVLPAGAGDDAGRAFAQLLFNG
jgi:hypothetical protein